MKRILLYSWVFIATPIVASTGFLVKPYLQPGSHAIANHTSQFTLLWQTRDSATGLTIEYRAVQEKAWRSAQHIKTKKISTPPSEHYFSSTVTLTALPEDAEIEYRFRNRTSTIFSARTHTAKPGSSGFRFVLFGDCGYGTPEQKRVAYQAYKAKPDFVVLTGDIVYQKGKQSEYQKIFWPVYNSDIASPETGAPLLRSTLTMTAIGNHDIYGKDFAKDSDGMAYFLNWSLPLNGPLYDTANTPTISGPQETKNLFLDAAGENYPRMAMYSFDYGNSHWTMLDANAYMDWSDSRVRDWLIQDLAQAKNSVWKFVAFHQPPFSSSKKHFNEQRMRLITGICQKAGVDVVFAGHVHNYQRTYPLTFEAMTNVDSAGRVDGTFTLDKKFDGKRITKPVGILYIVSGAGGAPLYDTAQGADRSSWQPFTAKFVSDKFSFTVCDIKDETLTLRQLSVTGKELDKVVVTK